MTKFEVATIPLFNSLRNALMEEKKADEEFSKVAEKVSQVVKGYGHERMGIGLEPAKAANNYGTLP
jgi:hypothetical protein